MAILSQKIAAHKNDFLSPFTRQLGGYRALALSVAAVIPTYSWCLQKEYSTGRSAHPFSVKSMAIVLHNRTLAWQDLSHAKSSRVVNSAWAC